MVNTINNPMVRDFPGELLNYSSVDSAMSEDEAIHFPVEFLNYSAPLLKSKLFQYHSALVDLQQSNALTHQCGRFLASFTSNGDIISRRKAKTAMRIVKT